MPKPRKSRHFDVDESIVRIGKRGLTPALINEVAKHLDKKKTVKIKVSKAALVDAETEDMSRRIADETQSEVVQLRGHTFIVHKSKKS